jgi:hypothetical protein
MELNGSDSTSIRAQQDLEGKRDMFEFLKSERFNQFFSFIIGLAIMSILKGKCEKDCTIMKAPPLEEVTHSTYQLGTTCYQFKSETVDCSSAEAGAAIIESFKA